MLRAACRCTRPRPRTRDSCDLSPRRVAPLGMPPLQGPPKALPWRARSATVFVPMEQQQQRWRFLVRVVGACRSHCTGVRGDCAFSVSRLSRLLGSSQICVRDRRCHGGGDCERQAISVYTTLGILLTCALRWQSSGELCCLGHAFTQRSRARVCGWCPGRGGGGCACRRWRKCVLPSRCQPCRSPSSHDAWFPASVLISVGMFGTSCGRQGERLVGQSFGACEMIDEVQRPV